MATNKTVKEPGKKFGAASVPATPPAFTPDIAARRLTRVASAAAAACVQFCQVVERQKSRGIAVAALEAELGFDSGDLRAHFEAAQRVAENSGVAVPAWT